MYDEVYLCQNKVEDEDYSSPNKHTAAFYVMHGFVTRNLACRLRVHLARALFSFTPFKTAMP